MGLLRAAATTAVVAGTATAVSGRVASRQAAKAAPPPAPAPAPAPMAAPMAPAPPEASNGAAKIQELAQMHAQGFITDEEFAAAKAKALGI